MQAHSFLLTLPMGMDESIDRSLRERPDAGLGAIVHADYRCARIGVRGPQLAA